MYRLAMCCKLCMAVAARQERSASRFRSELRPADIFRQAGYKIRSGRNVRKQESSENLKRLALFSCSGVLRFPTAEA
jgi:hypothetical protein